MPFTATTYITPSMERYELTPGTPDECDLTLCDECTLATAGCTSADTSDPATDEAAFWMEDQWSYPYAAQLTGERPAACSAAMCDGCGTRTPGSRTPATANRIG